MILFGAADELRSASFVPANSNSQTFHRRAANSSVNYDGTPKRNQATQKQAGRP
jgi:hypothetical protein